MKAEPVELEKGFIGISRGETTINAIIWAGDEDFYFLPVSELGAELLEDWDANCRKFSSLRTIGEILGLSSDDIELLYDGNIIE